MVANTPIVANAEQSSDHSVSEQSAIQQSGGNQHPRRQTPLRSQDARNSPSEQDRAFTAFRSLARRKPRSMRNTGNARPARHNARNSQSEDFTSQPEWNNLQRRSPRDVSPKQTTWRSRSLGRAHSSPLIDAEYDSNAAPSRRLDFVCSGTSSHRSQRSVSHSSRMSHSDSASSISDMPEMSPSRDFVLPREVKDFVLPSGGLMRHSTGDSLRASDLDRQGSEYNTPFDRSVIWKLMDNAPRNGKFVYLNNALQKNGLHTVPDYACGRILVDTRTTEKDTGYTQFVGSIFHVDDQSGITLLSSMPPPVLVVNARNLHLVEKHFASLEVIRAEDGTSLGLYWFRDQWVLRTPGSFDASEIKWDGRITFGTILADIMAKFPQFRFDRLDRTRCYTFGVKHHVMHPYREGKSFANDWAWFIQSVDIARVNDQSGIFNGSVSFDDSIGLLGQLPMTRAMMSELSSIPTHAHEQFHARYPSADHDKSAVSLPNLLWKSRGIINGAISGNPLIAGYYGVLLRNKKYTFFIQSDLQEYIASTYYTNEIREMLHTEMFSREKYIVLYHALLGDNVKRDLFSRVYPQYRLIIDRIREYLTTNLVGAMHVNYNRLTSGISEPQSEVDEHYDIGTTDLARQLFIVWRRRHGVPKSTDPEYLKSQFGEFVLNEKHTSAFYENVYSHIVARE